jgi:hypothetical protein
MLELVHDLEMVLDFAKNEESSQLYRGSKPKPLPQTRLMIRNKLLRHQGLLSRFDGRKPDLMAAHAKTLSISHPTSPRITNLTSTRQTIPQSSNNSHNDRHRTRRKREQDRHRHNITFYRQQTACRPRKLTAYLQLPARDRLPSQGHCGTSPSMGCEANQASRTASRY